MKELLEKTLLSLFIKPTILLMQAYGHNRARQREKLGALLEEMGDLQSEVFVFLFKIIFILILNSAH